MKKHLDRKGLGALCRKHREERGWSLERAGEEVGRFADEGKEHSKQSVSLVELGDPAMDRLRLEFIRMYTRKRPEGPLWEVEE